MRAEKKTNPDKIGFWKFWTWSLSGSPVAIQAVLLGFFQIYCTNALGLDALKVGSVLFASKIFDGITDLLAGYVVDKTKTRWGKGRPYEFAIFGIWGMTWLLFSVPAGISTTMKYVWIFVCYSLAQSVFLTLKNAAGNVYMVRAFNNQQKYIKLNSWGGMIAIIPIMVFNVVFPMMYGKVINDAAGWSRLILYWAVPLMFVGMLRFFVVKEEYDVDVSTEKIRIKDVLAILKSNRNIYPVAIVLGACNIASGMNVASYYFLYIVKNVEISGVLSIFTIFAMLTMIFFPVLLKKFSTARVIQYSLFLSIASGTVLFFAKDNLAMIAVGMVLVGIVSLPTSYLSSILIVECADYNEWKGLPRLEGTLTSVTNFAMKVGQAFGTLITGALLSWSGFDGMLEIQPDSANMMIRLIYSYIPTIIYVIAASSLFFYAIDKIKPQIDLELSERRKLSNPESVNENE